MVSSKSIAVALVAALGIPAPFLPVAQAAESNVEVSMGALSGSRQTGQATLYAEGARTRVVVKLDNPVAGPEPAHIHLGSCPVPNAVPAFPLSDVVNGRSETVLNIKLGALVAQPMAINVHQSPQQLGVYVSCGDIVGSDDVTVETTVDSVRENAREDTNQELRRRENR